MRECKYSSITLDLDTWWRWVVSFTPRSLCSRGDHRYPMVRSLVGPQGRSGRCGEIFLAPAVNRTPAIQPASIPPEPSWYNSYTNMSIHNFFRRSEWPRGLRHELSSPARTLGSWILIPLEAWMSVCVYTVFVLFCVQVAALRRAEKAAKVQQRTVEPQTDEWMNNFFFPNLFNAFLARVPSHLKMFCGFVTPANCRMGVKQNAMTSV
jgi:hypothetical protein